MDNSVERQEHVPPCGSHAALPAAPSCFSHQASQKGILSTSLQGLCGQYRDAVLRSRFTHCHCLQLSLPPSCSSPGGRRGVTVDGRAGTRAEPSLAPAGFLPQVVFAPELPPELPMSTNTRSGLRLVCGLPMPNPAPDSLPSPGCSRHNVFSLSSLSASVSPELPPGSISFR